MASWPNSCPACSHGVEGTGLLFVWKTAQQLRLYKMKASELQALSFLVVSLKIKP